MPTSAPPSSPGHTTSPPRHITRHSTANAFHLLTRVRPLGACAAFFCSPCFYLNHDLPPPPHVYRPLTHRRHPPLLLCLRIYNNSTSKFSSCFVNNVCRNDAFKPYSCLPPSKATNLPVINSMQDHPALSKQRMSHSRSTKR
ncbi:hypothetical protein E2C01_019633 [Portunus trituberculatus]|uniref:Uncharacterized protein n=1 Tax=Portunus trituberculatus TaxID=210409 RepID=A0A5B7DXS3_PORTR|nr:hypothetical protein [Portunus trituberculatus]